MKISFVQTGGTIDKDYPQADTHHGYGFHIGAPAYESVLKKSKHVFSSESISLLKKDSLDITEADRKMLVEKISKIENDKVVITHGTDTIKLSAQALSAITNKTIVLTGAMLPEKFYESEADFNIGMAIGGVQVLPHGVYICLNGILTKWDVYSGALGKK